MPKRLPKPAPGPSSPSENSPEAGDGGNDQAELGAMVRARRRSLGLTLKALGAKAGCAASYLSMIENDWRRAPGAGAGPVRTPSREVLQRLEASLQIEPGRLIRAAHWRSAPRELRREVEKLGDQQRATRELARLLAGAPGAPGGAAGGGGGGGGAGGRLDEWYRSGELKRLIDRLVPAEADGAGGGAGGTQFGGRPEGPAGSGWSLRGLLPVEVPLINSVAAGYPTEFTDLGYPARVADEYVRSPDIRDPDAFAARVVGDSMAPTYQEGDIVVFSPAKPVTSGMDCFVRIEPDQETTFKRVYLEGGGDDGPEMIRLQPLNPSYPARVLEREQVAGMYAAVSVTRAIGGGVSGGGGSGGGSGGG